MEIPGCGEPGSRAGLSGGTAGVDLGDKQDKGEILCCCSSWRCSRLDAGQGTLSDLVCVKHLAVPAAVCVCFPPRAANLLFVWREHFIWCVLASAASFHAQCSEIKGCSFPRPLLNASGLLKLVG